MIQCVASIVSFVRVALLALRCHPEVLPTISQSSLTAYALLTTQYIGIVYFCNCAFVNIKLVSTKKNYEKVLEFLDLKNFRLFIRKLLRRKIDLLSADCDRRHQLGLVQLVHAHSLLFQATGWVREAGAWTAIVDNLSSVSRALLHLWLVHYLTTKLADEFAVMYEKKRAYVVIRDLLFSPPSAKKELIGLGTEMSNILFFEEVARLCHKDLRFVNLEVAIDNTQSSVVTSSSSLSSSSSASPSTPTSSMLRVRELANTINTKDEIGVEVIESISQQFEELETYFLDIFENRHKPGIAHVHSKIVDHFHRSLSLRWLMVALYTAIWLCNLLLLSSIFGEYFWRFGVFSYDLPPIWVYPLDLLASTGLASMISVLFALFAAVLSFLHDVWKVDSHITDMVLFY